jgi:hypothetical protein
VPFVSYFWHLLVIYLPNFAPLHGSRIITTCC